MILSNLLIIAFGGALLAYIIEKVFPKSREYFAVLISLVVVIITACFYNKPITGSTYFYFFGLPLILRLNMFSWFFAISISSLGLLSIIFSINYMKGRKRLDFYYLMMLLINASMLGIVLSGDLVSFYIFWEIMSICTFLLISYNRGTALAAGMKYIIMSVIGSVTMLIGILSLYTTYGTLIISEISHHIASASFGYILFLLILFFVAFGIKNAVWPFHTWLPDAHSEAPSPFSAVLSGILIKMGTYGFILAMYVIAGLNIFLSLGGGSFHYILSLLAAITIIVPTFIAIFQDDAKRLLAWSSIAQVGYIILGIAIGTGLGFMGGMFHFFNHAAFKALLFLSIGAIEYRTGTRDLNSLGGLVKRMPITFIATLIGVCGLIGIPLTNGFVSKWLIYKTLILEGHPFLAFIALFGTWGTILYSYKLIHNVFLGQLPERFKNTEEVPMGMKFSVLVLSLSIILFGILPGIPLKGIATIGSSFGFQSQEVTMWGISSETGTLNMVNIFAAISVALIFVWLLFRVGKKKVSIAQDNNYAAGSYIPKGKYHYTVEFYEPLFRMIRPYLKDFVDEFYSWLVKAGRNLSDRIRKIYCGDLGSYITYIILFLAILIILKFGLKPW